MWVRLPPEVRKEKELMRLLRIKFFLGSTTEEIQGQVALFIENMCPGNYIDLKLWKLGNVYQAVLIYAELK
jgi:hypothetical protein